MDKDPTPRPLYKSLYAQVITAIIIGVILGHFWPHVGEAMKPLGDGFIKLIKMIIAPIIFCTVVVGIAGMEDMKKVGKTGGLALLYFEIVSTIALIVGLVIVNVVQPGAGMNVDPATLDTKQRRRLHRPGQDAGHGRVPARRSSRTPWSTPSPRARSCRCCCSRCCSASRCTSSAAAARSSSTSIEKTSHVLFAIVGIIMKVAPIGAFGAMAFTIGKYGIGSLLSLGKLMGTFYATCLFFIFVVLGLIARLHGFSIWKFIKYIKEELLIVLGTSSLGVGAAADDGQDGEPRRARSRSSAW